MPDSAMNRRQFVRIAVIGAGACLTAAAGCTRGAHYDVATLASPGLVGAMGADVVRAIGVRYRAMVPAERTVISLVAAIETSISGSRPLSARLPWAKEPSLAEVVRSDFANGRTVVVDGWILSATEARQCALYSLRNT